LYTNACEEIFDPRIGLFKLTSNGSELEINPLSHTIPFYQKLFEYAGIMLAKAFSERVTVKAFLSTPLLKSLLGRKHVLQDLKDVDIQMFKGL